jgi:hypothetical protein
MQVDLPLNLRYGAIALFCLGPAVLLIAGLGALSTWDKQTWPAATAEVLRSDIEASKQPIGFSLKGRTHRADYFTARCVYTYEVNGKRFTQKAICAKSFDRVAVERGSQPYSSGNQITIYYSPRRPENSILSKKADIAGLAIGFGLGGLAIPLGLVLQRIARKMSPATPVHSVPARGTLGVVNPFDVRGASCGDSLTTQPAVQHRLGILQWLLRGIAVSTGILFILVGGLCVAVCLAQFAKAPDPTRAEVDMAVRIVATGIFGLIPLLGAVLLWLGLRRTRSVQSSTAAQVQPAHRSSDHGLSPFNPSIST